MKKFSSFLFIIPLLLATQCQDITQRVTRESRISIERKPNDKVVVHVTLPYAQLVKANITSFDLEIKSSQEIIASEHHLVDPQIRAEEKSFQLSFSAAQLHPDGSGEMSILYYRKNKTKRSEWITIIP